MIVPNLAVRDIARSVRFYRDTIGMTLTMTVSPTREVGWPGELDGASFATLEWDDCQLMLQTVASLADELTVFEPDHAPMPSRTIYFRGLHPDSARDRVVPADIVKGPQRSWYGMTELYVRDPDSYVICTGAADESMKTRKSADGRSNRSSSYTIRASGIETWDIGRGTSDRTRKHLMNDLAYAPPSFTDKDGRKVVFVDFTEARYRLEFDARAKKAAAFSEITFLCDAEGHPALSLNQRYKSASLDGQSVKLEDPMCQDKKGLFKILSRPVKPGSHVLTVESRLRRKGPYGHPVRWRSRLTGVECIFNMSDGKLKSGGYLEAFLPSNYNFDRFRMSLSVTIRNYGTKHSVYSNGAIKSLAGEQWRIEFPSYFTSACPWFHLAPSHEFQSLEDTFASSDGRIVPIVVYTNAEWQDEDIDLERFMLKTKTILHDLESDFGPFPHGSVTVFAREGVEPSGMEYAGAAATNMDALRHELDHSYFARSIMPADGNAGWVDEAIAVWGDEGYLSREKKPKNGVNMGARSPYVRITSQASYEMGSQFLAHLDHVLRERHGPKRGLKSFLREYARTKRHQSVTAIEFQELLEDYHGESLQELFDAYVYSQGPKQQRMA